jgi:hypothetical protein
MMNDEAGVVKVKDGLSKKKIVEHRNVELIEAMKAKRIR